MKNLNTNHRVELHKLTILDVFVIILILLLSTGVIFRGKLGLAWQAGKAAEASVYHAGKLFKSLPLDNDQEIVLLDGKMLLDIHDGRVRVRKSDCPRQICVNAGWIEHPGETVACVPFKTLIEIESSDTPVVDVVVY